MTQPPETDPRRGIDPRRGVDSRRGAEPRPATDLGSETDPRRGNEPGLETDPNPESDRQPNAGTHAPAAGRPARGGGGTLRGISSAAFGRRGIGRSSRRGGETGAAEAGAMAVPRPPDPHPSGARPPNIPAQFVPRHVAIVMDGNGRWAKQRGLPRTAGHEAGEAALFDVIEGAIEVGVKYLSAYAFSTENWRRSPDEVRFLMGFNRDVIHRRRDELHARGVRIRWAGRRPRLWRSVIKELEYAEELSRDNDVITLQFCVNYGGRAEIADAATAIAREVAAGRLKPDRVNEKLLARYLDEPDIPDVDLFIRSSGEQRFSNFLLWQSAYAEMVFLDTLWPDFDRRELWKAVEIYASRDRRYGGAIPNPNS
jgi:trans,polycis-polyprenyl diphosphate synthase